MWRTILENTLGLLGGELRGELRWRRDNPDQWADELRRRQGWWEDRAGHWEQQAEVATRPRDRRKARRRRNHAIRMAEFNRRRADRVQRRAKD